MTLFVNSIKEHIKHISHHEPKNGDNDIQSDCNIKMKSKYYYRHLVKHKKSKPQIELKWHDIMSEDIKLENVYINKIVNISDNKLKQINFKILNRILSCGVNFKKWKTKNSDNGTICSKIESIEHLIYNCRYSAKIWTLVQKSLCINITLKDLILGVNQNPEVNFVTSLIVYLIYKEWCNYSMVDNNRPPIPNTIKYIHELEYYRKICEKNKQMAKNSKIIHSLMDELGRLTP